MSAGNGTAPADDRRMLRIRLAAFAALGSLAALQWGSLIAEPPTARLLGVALIAVPRRLGIEPPRSWGDADGPPWAAAAPRRSPWSSPARPRR